MFPHHIECHPITLPRCLMLDFITSQQVCQIPSQPFSLLRPNKWKTHQLSFILYYRGTYCPSSLLPSHLSLYTSPSSSPTRSMCLCIETLERKINLLSDICRALALYKRFGGNSFQIISKLPNLFPPPRISTALIPRIWYSIQLCTLKYTMTALCSAVCSVSFLFWLYWDSLWSASAKLCWRMVFN